MNCRFTDLRCKEVINICDGCRLGYVGDVECRLPDGQLTALIVPGPYRFFGLFGRESDLYNQYANLCFRIFLSGIVFTCVQKAGSIFLQSIGKPVQSTLLSLWRDLIFRMGIAAGIYCDRRIRTGLLYPKGHRFLYVPEKPVCVL